VSRSDDARIRESFFLKGKEREREREREKKKRKKERNLREILLIMLRVIRILAALA